MRALAETSSSVQSFTVAMVKTFQVCGIPFNIELRHGQLFQSSSICSFVRLALRISRSISNRDVLS